MLAVLPAVILFLAKSSGGGRHRPGDLEWWQDPGMIAVVCLAVAGLLWVLLAPLVRRLRQPSGLPGTPVEGTVVFHTQKKRRGQSVYFAKIKYKTPDGREYRHTASEGQMKPWPPLGTKVLVKYSRSDPAVSAIVNWDQIKQEPRPG